MGTEVKSSTTALDQTISNNDARREKLEALKKVFIQKEEAAKTLCKNIRKKMSIFLSDCGVRSVSHLSEEKKRIFKGLESDYYGAKMSAISAGNGFLSTNLSIFNLILDNGKLEMQNMVLKQLNR